MNNKTVKQNLKKAKILRKLSFQQATYFTHQGQ